VEFVTCPTCEDTEPLDLVLRLGRCAVCDTPVADYAHAGSMPVGDRRRGAELWFWLGWPSRRRDAARTSGRRRGDVRDRDV